MVLFRKDEKALLGHVVVLFVEFVCERHGRNILRTKWKC